jgi:hypothetical protein
LSPETSAPLPQQSDPPAKTEELANDNPRAKTNVLNIFFINISFKVL